MFDICSPFSSKRRSSLLQTCGCALSCAPAVCCINCEEKRGIHSNQVEKQISPGKPPQSHLIFSPVDVAHVFHHEPPQVLVEVGETGEGPLQELRVLGFQQRGDQDEEVWEVGVEVSLEVSGQLHHQAGGRKSGETPLGGVTDWTHM